MSLGRLFRKKSAKPALGAGPEATPLHFPLAGESEADPALVAYADLMVRCIANTIYLDAGVNPADHATEFHQGRRENGLDWPVTAHSMVGVKRLASLAEQTIDVIRNGVPGDFIETGVWRGGACILMSGIARAMGASDRLIHVADSFEGLPRPDGEKFPADAGDLHHSVDLLAVSEEEVRRNFASYGLLDDRVRFVKGWFSDTLHRIEAERFAIVRLDGDMYESTIQALEALYPKLSVGGYLIVDDYHAVPACKAAIHDFRDARGIGEEMVPIDETAVFWQRSG